MRPSRPHQHQPQELSVSTGGRGSSMSSGNHPSRLPSEIPSSPPPAPSSVSPRTTTTAAIAAGSPLAAHRDFLQAKAAVHVLLLFGITALLHWIQKPYGDYVVWVYSFLTFVYLARLFFYPLPPESTTAHKMLASWKNMSSIDLALRGSSTRSTTYRVVHILIPAKREAAVIGNVLEACLALDYPETRLQIYAIHDNDNNSDNDGTAEIMQHYATQHPGMIRVLHHAQQQQRQHDNNLNNNSQPDTFKAGALNMALPYLPQRDDSDDLVLVLNADATIEPDALRQAVPFFQSHDNNNNNKQDDPPIRVGAIQFRKQYINGDYNSWTKSQVSEIGFDHVLQLQRSAMAHTGELRGNGYMLRSRLLTENNKSGFATSTLTEDLDLTCQLTCLQQQRVLNVVAPVVTEEAVIGPIALWKQRCRWCQGGFQRHLEYYWPVLFSKTPGVLKWYQWVDVLLIGMIQYALPLISIMDLVFSIAMRRILTMWFPFQCVVTLFGALFMMRGIYQTFEKVSVCFLLMQTFFGLLFMGNWFFVVMYVTFRMAFFPMRHHWVKTEHGLWNQPEEDADDKEGAVLEVVLSKNEAEMGGGSTASESGMAASSMASTDSSRSPCRDEEVSSYA